MARYFRELSSDLAYCACLKCLEHKWHRKDVLAYVEEWTGYSRYELWERELESGMSFGIKYDILCELAYAAEDMVDGILHGIDPDFDPVSVRERQDGTTGKMRRIAYLCMRHQILGHMVKLGIEPLLKARLLPMQHASIPKHGQTGLARQVKRMLNRRLGIKLFAKTDCTSAYASVQYSACAAILQKEIPRAKWIHACMRVLGRYAPGGHLIIGGFLDAWLFNLVMSYAMRFELGLSKNRRGTAHPMIIRCASFMDDLLVLGKNKTAMIQAVKKLEEWLWVQFEVRLRFTTGVLQLYPAEDEKARKRRSSPAARGCPMIDMAGFRIGRSHVTLRRRNVCRTLRCFSRAWREYTLTGTLKRQRAGQIISRNGMIRHTNAYRLIQKYHVRQLLAAARKVQAYWSRQATRKRKERLRHVVSKHTKRREAIPCAC